MFDDFCTLTVRTFNWQPNCHNSLLSSLLFTSTHYSQATNLEHHQLVDAPNLNRDRTGCPDLTACSTISAARITPPDWRIDCLSLNA